MQEDRVPQAVHLPVLKGVANYDKKVAGYVTENWCAGQCGKGTPPTP